jgi:hypothetical protein
MSPPDHKLSVQPQPRAAPRSCSGAMSSRCPVRVELWGQPEYPLSRLSASTPSASGRLGIGTPRRTWPWLVCDSRRTPERRFPDSRSCTSEAVRRLRTAPGPDGMLELMRWESIRVPVGGVRRRRQRGNGATFEPNGKMRRNGPPCRIEAAGGPRRGRGISGSDRVRCPTTGHHSSQAEAVAESLRWATT